MSQPWENPEHDVIGDVMAEVRRVESQRESGYDDDKIYPSSEGWTANPIATLRPSGPTCLEEAQHLIYGDRQQQYGGAKKNFGDIAALWSVVLGTPVSDRQVAICLLQLKVARAMRDLEVGGDVKPDTLADMAGYVGCIEKIERDL